MRFTTLHKAIDIEADFRKPSTLSASSVATAVEFPGRLGFLVMKNPA